MNIRKKQSVNLNPIDFEKIDKDFDSVNELFFFIKNLVMTGK